MEYNDSEQVFDCLWSTVPVLVVPGLVYWG